MSLNILITGASKGIGRATAIALAQPNTQLTLIARSADPLEETAQLARERGAEVLTAVGSVSDEAFVKATVADAIAHWGRIDVLINNAGIGSFKPVVETSSADWERVMDTNAKGTFLWCQAIAPHLQQQRSGHIINIASDVAKRTFAGGALYCASKYAQEAFSQALRKEMRPFGVKVSVVYSGLVDSDFHTEPQGDASHLFWLKNEDMARAIQFLIAQPAHVVIDELMIHPLQQDY
jgi:NADP-dependent 3-hydroxy acid dehydrogenase YdfG